VGVREISEDSGDLVIRTVDWAVVSAIGCSRNVVNVVVYSYKSLPRYFRAFLIKFFGSVPRVRNEVSDTAVSVLLGLPFRPRSARSSVPAP
jgi:hypothetical protein